MVGSELPGLSTIARTEDERTKDERSESEVALKIRHLQNGRQPLPLETQGTPPSDTHAL